MQVYKMAKGWALFVYILCPILIGVFLFPIALYFVPAWRDADFENYAGFLVPLALFFILFMLAAIVDTARGRVIIDQEKIYTRYLAFNSSIPLKEIKGFRVDDRYLYLESKMPGVRWIKISKYYGKLPELIEWLEQNYPDLDEWEAEQEFQELTQDHTYGWSEEERIQKFTQARKVTNAVNWAGGIGAAWVLFWPEPYKIAMLTACCIPLLALGVLKYFKGMVRVDERKNSPYPSVFFGLLLSSLGLFIRALFDFNLYDYSPIWLPMLLCSTVLLALTFINNPEVKEKKAKDWLLMVLIFGLTTGYSYGLLVAINGIFSNSTVQVYTAEIVNKDKSTGKTTSYYFELSPWDPRQTAEEVQVSGELYQHLELGDSVQVFLIKGALGYPWIEVGAKGQK